MRLTATSVKALQPTGSKARYPDHEVRGLYLRMTPAGTKTWAIIYRDAAGKQKEMALGSADLLAIHEARVMAQTRLADRLRGIDPLEARREERSEAQRAQANTLGAVIERYQASVALKQKKEKTLRWEDRILMHQIMPILGDLPVGEIGRRHVRELHDQIMTRHGDQSANAAHRVLSVVMSFAAEREIIPANPLLGMRQPARKKVRERVLSNDELRALWQAANDGEGMDKGTGRAVLLCLLTAQRRSEIAAMTWDEVCLESKAWTLPDARTKNHRAHRVPLSALAVELLKAQQEEAGESPFVFPGRSTEKSLYDGAIKRACGRMAQTLGWESFGPHDLRRTATTSMATMGISADVLARILNHTPPGGAALMHYNHGNYEPQMRHALDSWAGELLRLVKGDPADEAGNGKIIAINGRKEKAS